MNLDRHDPQPGRRTIALTLALLIAVLVAAQPLSAAGPKAERKNKKSQTVTRTFANVTPIDILESGPSSPYPTEIVVSGFRKGRVKDVNLRLRGLSHEFPDDVDILLLAPGGQSSMVISDAGGVSDLFDVDLTFDDQATDTLTDEGLIVSGTFKPADFERDLDDDEFPEPAPPAPRNVGFFVFNGGNPNGAWSLFVFDDGGGDVGSIANGWELTIRADVEKGGKGKGRGKGKRK